MKRSLVCLVLLIVLRATGLAPAATLYEEDFSSGAPGWVFGPQGNFKWDETNQRLRIEPRTDFSGYAYVELPQAPQGSFRLSWTFGVESFPFVSGCNPALSSSIEWPKQGDLSKANFVSMGFNSSSFDGDNAHMVAHNGSDHSARRATWLDPAGKTYDFSTEYDAATLTLTRSVREKGVEIGSWTDAFELSKDMRYIMINENRTITGWLDNIILTPEPSTFAMLSIGAVGLLVYAWRGRTRRAKSTT